ncbi:Melanoma-associated antigen B17 [Saguinus oedipus]|uniref:Melanoma-associated antigen B17 n=1 Tax=Saguinus oedipus TaxID=9490 RepID=A0ABQ9TED4_SAGOE|nr:Melanoma-associated antigen B17 [Saguinus oedipus]
MPRGQESKRRAREKRCQARGEDQCLRGAQATAAEEERLPSSSFPACQSASQSPPAAGIPQESQKARYPSSPAAAVSLISSDEGAKGQNGESPNSSRGPSFSESSGEDLLDVKTGELVQFLLNKYVKKEPFTREAMMKVINRKYKQHFPEILQRSAENVDLVFGLELKEMDPIHHVYMLVSKLDFPNQESLSDGRDFPKSGLLMVLLSMIFMHGNRATEEQMWECLGALGMHKGRKHFIFGEPQELVTKDLVQEGYLEYQQVPGSDPPRCEFLWGPRAYAETNKMKVLEFVAKHNDTVASAYQPQYEEALRDEEERARARVAARAAARARCSRSSQP